MRAPMHRHRPGGRGDTQRRSRPWTTPLALLVAAAGLPAGSAQEPLREGRYDAAGYGQYVTTGTFTQGATEIAYGSGWGGAFGLTYHIDDRLAVGLEFSAAGLNSELRDANRDISFNTTLYSGFFTVAYHLLETSLTPFVEAVLGIHSFSSDFRGYTSSDTSFAGGVGAGLRWDAGPNWLFKLSYRITATGLSDADGWIPVQTVLLGVGYRF